MSALTSPGAKSRRISELGVRCAAAGLARQSQASAVSSVLIVTEPDVARRRIGGLGIEIKRVLPRIFGGIGVSKRGVGVCHGKVKSCRPPAGLLGTFKRCKCTSG